MLWHTNPLFSFTLPAGSQAEAHGRAAAISCHRSGDASSDPDADTAVGGEPGAAALRTVPAALLHGLAAERRAAQSEGELWPLATGQATVAPKFELSGR